MNIIGLSETLCTHPVSGKVIAMDKVDTKDLLCNYLQVDHLLFCTRSYVFGYGDFLGAW